MNNGYVGRKSISLGFENQKRERQADRQRKKENERDGRETQAN